MPSPNPTSLQDLLASLRQDLMDTDATAYRWTDLQLRRAIDLALDRYSQVAPRFQIVQIPTVPRCRLYPAPAGCWYVERVEYPVGRWPKRFCTYIERTSPLLQSPPAPALIPGAANLSGTYGYAVTLLTSMSPPAAETIPSPAGQIVLAGQGTQVSLPTGPYGTVGRALYRTTAGGAALLLAAIIPDNSTVSYLDSLPDAALGAPAPDINTTAGVPCIELQIESARLPQDGWDVIEMTAAYKHQLDPLGTTVPDAHMDAIALGARAHALYAYLTTTNDNFDYVDGQFRDRVDDTKAPDAWRAHARDAMDRFDARLEFIKHESNAAIVPQLHWGDEPIRWERL